MTTSLAGQTVVVMGATGQQGGATARHLLAEGYSVRAVVRDPRSPGSQGLANIGVELVVGDMDDRESLRAAMRGAYGIFSVQPALIPPTFAENELQRGLNVADAAHEAGIAHVVYSSVAGANRRTGIPFTMLRPTLFMDMHADATYGVTGELSLVRSLPSNANVQHIAIADVAAFTALALANPSHYLGKALELAGDDVDRRPSPHRDRPCQRTL